MAGRVATIVGVLLVIVGIGGFLSPHALGAHLSPTHNTIHLVTGVISFLVGALASRGAARTFCLLFGLAYGLLGVAGFLLGRPEPGGDPRMMRIVAGHFELGSVDHTIHVVLGAVYVAAALATRTRPGPGAPPVTPPAV